MPPFSKVCVTQGWDHAIVNKTPENKEEEGRRLAGDLEHFQLVSWQVSPFLLLSSMLQIQRFQCTTLTTTMVGQAQAVLSHLGTWPAWDNQA